MKKFFIILSCVFFINSTLDSENIELDIERLGENSVQISWSINYEEYDRIVLEVLNQNNSERTRYILPSLKGVVELCCFEGDVGATITITKSKAVDKSDEDCSALTCIEYVKEDYFNSKIVTAYQPTTTTTSTTSTIPPTTSTTTTTTTSTTVPVILEEVIEDSSLSTRLKNLALTYLPWLFGTLASLFLITKIIKFLRKVFLPFLRRSSFTRVAISLSAIAAIFSFFYLFTNQQEDIVEEVAELTSPESIIQNMTTTTVPVIVEEPSTTTSLVPISKIAVSEDSESVQIIGNEDEDVEIYEGPFTSFAGFEGTNQTTLEKLVSELPSTLKKIIENEVLVINGCHQYALSLVGRCPYGVWDSSGTDPEGEKGAEWSLSIWISDRAFGTEQVRDVLVHEASHALSYLTKTCISPENSNYRKDAWDYFGGEEQFADALVLYFEGVYNHYRTKGPLTQEEIKYLDSYISVCTGN